MSEETSTTGAEGDPRDLYSFLRFFESLVPEPGLQDISEGISCMNVNKNVGGLQPITETKVSAALLNFWSVNNKLSKFKNLIEGKKLDVFLITETYLTNSTEGELIGIAQSLNYTVYHKMREDKKGGGVAIVVSNDLKSESVELQGPTTAFEFVAAELQHKLWAEPVLVINVYRPPRGNFQDFLKEFQKILDQAKKYHKLIVTGDFNIWVDNKNNTKSKEFKSLLDDNELVQHVRGSTHKKGHTLDLVISRNDDTVSDLNVNNDQVADHFTIYFKIRALQKQAKQKE